MRLRQEYDSGSIFFVRELRFQAANRGAKSNIDGCYRGKGRLPSNFLPRNGRTVVDDAGTDWVDGRLKEFFGDGNGLDKGM